MDQELIALASSGATTIVGLMLTDAWQEVKTKIGRILGRGRSDGHTAVEAELEASRRELVVAEQVGDSGAEAELVREWQGRLRRMFTTDPDLAIELRAVLAELASRSDVHIHRIEMKAEAKDHGRVYQQGQGTQVNG